MQIEYELLGELSTHSIPENLSEALDRLQQLVPAEAPAAFLRCKNDRSTEYCRDFFVQFELRFRRQISNEWMRPADSPLAQAFREGGIDNFEIMASVLVRRYVDSLQETQ